MRIEFKLILSVLLLGYGIATMALEPIQTSEMAKRIEFRGNIESLDLSRQRITINGQDYSFHQDFEVVRYTEDGVVGMDPSRLTPNLQVGVERQNDSITRLHVLDPATIR